MPSLTSKGLEAMYTRTNTPPVNGFSDRFHAGGTYDALSADRTSSSATSPTVHIGITTAASHIADGCLYLRRDTGSSSVGLDTQGFRGTSRSNPKIGQYIIKNESTSVTGGTYAAAWFGSGYANVSDNKSASNVSELKGIFYRYA